MQTCSSINAGHASPRHTAGPFRPNGRGHGRGRLPTVAAGHSGSVLAAHADLVALRRLTFALGTAPGAYPVVAFGHGFLQSSSRYAGTLDSIASRGYIVIAPDSETGFAPNHSRFADDLWRCLRWAGDPGRYPNADPDSLMGHSMGGGAALVAADRYDGPGQIDTVATLSAAETNPSARAASAGIAVPALYVIGSQDTIVRPPTTRAMYDIRPQPRPSQRSSAATTAGSSTPRRCSGSAATRGRAQPKPARHLCVGEVVRPRGLAGESPVSPPDRAASPGAMAWGR